MHTFCSLLGHKGMQEWILCEEFVSKPEQWLSPQQYQVHYRTYLLIH